MGNPATSSGLKSSDAVICARPCKIKSIIALADGTNAATIVLYDNKSAASGTELVKIVVDAGLTYELFHIDAGVEALNGAYLDLTGTGAAAIVHYESE
jgi:hypothetical protein